MWGQWGFEPQCACLCFWGLWGSRESLMAQREGCSHMQREAGRGIKRESARAHQGFVSAISGLTSILAQDSLDPNAFAPALLMLAWVHFCYFSADCHVQNWFSGSVSLIYRWKWAMRYDLGPHSPIFAEPLARLSGNRDEQHRVLLCAPSVQSLQVCRELHCGKIPHLIEQELWQPWMPRSKSSKFQFF